MPDPTRNVLDLVEAAIKRQDDLRASESESLRREAALRAEYDEKLRMAETARIDAIRAVDVGAVNRAAEVSSQVASTLAAAVAASAEALRDQVSAVASASDMRLAAALDPIQKAIDDLRRAQYEAQGVKTQSGDSRLNVGSIVGIIAGVVGLAGLILAIFLGLR
jgi:hypothetical protein